MLLNFKEWFIAEMARGDIRRDQVEMDQDDINYLYQFPPSKWTRRLKERYNDHLNAALDEDGNIKRDIPGDIKQSVTPVVRKLRAMDFDLRNINPGSGYLAGMKLMSSYNAQHLLRGVRGQSQGWLKWSQEQSGGEPGPKGITLVPGYKLWRPNHMVPGTTGRPRDVNDPTQTFITDTMMRHLKAEAEEVVRQHLDQLRIDKDARHEFMMSNQDVIVRTIIDHLIKSTREEGFGDSEWRQEVAHKRMNVLKQRAWDYASRRQRARAKSMGLSPEQLANLIKSGKAGDILRGRGRPKKVAEPAEPAVA
jgi:hypothetical protein